MIIQSQMFSPENLLIEVTLYRAGVFIYLRLCAHARAHTHTLEITDKSSEFDRGVGVWEKLEGEKRSKNDIISNIFKKHLAYIPWHVISQWFKIDNNFQKVKRCDSILIWELFFFLKKILVRF